MLSEMIGAGLGGEWGTALATMLLGYVSTFEAQHERAAALARSLASLGYVEELRGDLDAAEACHGESLQAARGLPDELPLAMPLAGLAWPSRGANHSGQPCFWGPRNQSARTNAVGHVP